MSCRGFWNFNLQSHSKRPLLRIVASQRHPRDVKSVGEGSEHLREDDAKVAGALAVELAENAVEDVAEHVEAEADYHRFAAAVTVESWMLVL
jgi:hypothetical protein